MVGLQAYKACELNKDGKPTGIFHFVCVTSDALRRQLIYPLGYCRANNFKGKTPCAHKTPQEANDCFRKYEMDHEARCFSGEDFIVEGKEMKGRNEIHPCVECKKETKAYILVGVRNFPVNLCEEHQKRDVLEKHYPHYEVVKDPSSK